MAILYSREVKMTAILERLITIIAPHSCFVCGVENNTLCDACAEDVFAPPLSHCVLCAKPTADWRLCGDCRGKTKLGSVWVAALYEGVVTELLHNFKFERTKAPYKPLALAMHDSLPHLAPDTLIVPLPTASSRIRQRGYDQTLLLAKKLAELRGLQLGLPFERADKSRQLGANRKQRHIQAKAAYLLPRPSLATGKNILLVDDICTTGASLTAAAALLHKAGATRIDAAVVAWQRPKS